MIKEIIYILIILAGIPNGLLLAKLCKDELKAWKNRFTYIAIISLASIIIIYFSSLELKIPIIIALFFMITTSLTIIKKAKN